MSNINYNKTIIYAIQCLDRNVREYYIDYTSNLVSKKSYHRHNFMNSNCRAYNKSIYQTIRETGGWFNWEFKHLELFSCENKQQAVDRQWFWHCHYAEPQPTSTIASVKEKAKQYRINNRLTSLMIQTNEVLRNEIKQQKIKKLYNELIDELIIFNRLSNPLPEYELQPIVIQTIVEETPDVVEAIPEPIDNPTFEPFSITPYVFQHYIYQ